MRVVLGTVLVLLMAPLAGCLTGDELASGARSALETVPQRPLALLDGGGFTLKVPVDVVLVGFEAGTADALAAQLSPETIDHGWETYEGYRSWPLVELPYDLTATYTVHPTTPAFGEAFWAHVAEKGAGSDEPRLFDANAAEAYLAEHLPAAGIPMDPARVTLVVLHASGALPTGHAWQIGYEHGALEPVRHFGERTPLVVHDLSARPDPYVGGAGANLLTPQRALEQGTRSYNERTPAGGPEAIEALEAYVRDATHHRALQGPTFPISTWPCHDVSILMAVDTATLSGKAPDWQPPEDWLDADVLEATFTNLTGDDVRVTVQWLELPQDDPELSALTRAAGWFVPTWDPLYEHLQDNWHRFTDTRPGCEGYLSMAYFGDLVGGAHGNGGFAVYGADEQRRISYSVRQDMARLLDDVDHQASDAQGTDEDQFPSPRLNSLVSHETGHLFGLLHPQNARRAGGSTVMNAVEAAHTVMSYQNSGLTDSFGTVDHITWARNRAAFSLWRAHVLGLEDTRAFQQASEAMNSYDWLGVHEVLAPHIQAAGDVTVPGASWHAVGSEPVPVGVAP